MFTYVVIFFTIIAVGTICASLYYMHKARHGWR